MRKKHCLGLLVAAIFTFIIALGVMPAYADNSMTDINEHWAESQIKSLVDQGVVDGYPENEFRPDNPISRAEFFTMTNLAFGFTSVTEISYTDVKASDWYEDEIVKAQAAGYISGYEDGTIKPDSKISRQEVAVVIARIMNLETSDSIELISEFKDSGNIPTWSRNEIAALLESGFMSGYPDQTLKASNFISRAESVVLLSRIMGREQAVIYDEAGTYGPQTGMNTVEGNVTIAAPGIILRNTVIEGDLLIAEAVGDGDATFENVVVKGDTVINGGGAHSVEFIDCTFATITIDRENNLVRIIAKGDTSIGTVHLRSGAILQEDEMKGKGFTDVVMLNLPEDASVILEGGFREINLDVPNINVEVTGGIIERFNISEAAQGTVITGSGQISCAEVNAPGVSIARQPIKTIVEEGITAEVGTKVITRTTIMDDDDDDIDPAAAMQASRVEGLAASHIAGVAGNGKVRLDWAPLTARQIRETRATGYEIYYIESASLAGRIFNKDNPAALKVTVADARTSTAEISGLNASEEYNFVIYAVNWKPTYSMVSEEVTKTVKAHYVSLEDFQVAGFRGSDVAGAEGNGQVKLDWTPLTAQQIIDTGAAGYEIYYIDSASLAGRPLNKDNPAALKLRVADAGTSTATLSGLTPLTEYSFVIYAVDNTTPYSNVSDTLTKEVKADFVDTAAVLEVSKVEGLVGTDVAGVEGNGQVKLDWTSLTDQQITDTAATGYEIYYIESGSLFGRPLNKNNIAAAKVSIADARTSTTTISGLDAAVEYSFVIYAVDGAPNYSVVSDVLSKTVKEDIINLSAFKVEGLVGSDVAGIEGNGKVKLDWTALTAQQIVDTGAIGYEIYYINSENEALMLWDKNFAAKVMVNDITTSTTTISGLIPAAEYSFIIYAVDGVLNYSTVSETVRKTVKDDLTSLEAAKVSGLTGTDVSGLTGNGKVKLDWTPLTAEQIDYCGATAYEIYYIESTSLAGRPLNKDNPMAIKITAADARISTAIISGLTASTEYSFVIYAVDNTPQYSIVSDAVTKVVRADLLSLQNFKVEGLAGSDIDGAAGNGKLKLDWTAFTAQQISDTAATGYEIYYIETESLSGRPLNKDNPMAVSLLVEDARTYTVIISGLTPLTEYSFVIYAVDATPNYSAASDMVTKMVKADSVDGGDGR